MTSHTQNAGLMMNKKERSTHKGDEGEKRLLKSEGEAENTERERGERLFYPTRMDEVILLVRPPRDRDL